MIRYKDRRIRTILLSRRRVFGMRLSARLFLKSLTMLLKESSVIEDVEETELMFLPFDELSLKSDSPRKLRVKSA